MIKGIDISEHNGSINWNSVKKDGVGFVIIRDGFGRSTLDNKFYANVSRAKNAGVRVEGVYHFSYALNETDARNEADITIKHAQDAGLGKDTIIFFDLEYDSVRYARDCGVNLDKSKCIAFTNAFCNRVKELGYKAGVYANGDYYWNMYNSGNGIPKDVIFWYADWRSNPDATPKNKATYWQYSESGRVSGINGNVDMNYRLKDISFENVKYKELTKEEIEKIANEVMAGKWGNGEERRKKLNEAGYDYSVIQSRVNDICATRNTDKPVNQDKKLSTAEVVAKVINGEYGNGEERKKKLTAEGYNYNDIQSAVNKALTPGSQSVSKAKEFDKNLSGTYEVTASALNMRYIPGLITPNNVVKILYSTYKVKCWGYYTLIDGNKWLLIQDGNLTGFVDSKFIKKI